jgi:hypothetical protein
MQEGANYPCKTKFSGIFTKNTKGVFLNTDIECIRQIDYDALMNNLSIKSVGHLMLKLKSKR